MKKIGCLFLVLLFLLTSCVTTASPANDGNIAQKDTKVEEGLQEKDDCGYLEIPTVQTGPLDECALIFEGVALQTLLPRDWMVQKTDGGGYTILRGGKKIGEATRGKTLLGGWSVLDEDFYETEEGIIIDTFIDQNDADGAYRRRVYFSLVEQPWISVTFWVNYEELDENALNGIWFGTKTSAAENYPNYDILWDVEEGETALILGNSFIGTSQIGIILKQMLACAPFSLSVQAVSTGFAHVGTYTGNAEIMKAIKDGRYGCVFICGFYSEGEVENLELLRAACAVSDTPLVIFPAHNESPNVIDRAVRENEDLCYLPWRDEINVLMSVLDIDQWDMCINDTHKHSTPLAGYVGAHMIALCSENPRRPFPFRG